MASSQKSTGNIKRQKVILHMDGDAFFVGVEVAKNPKLRGKAVVTGEERGIVSALSYEAKVLGVKRGMPIFRLKKEFPSVVVLPGDYKAYVKYSGKMFEIVRRYADEVEEYSIDECFADLTGLDRTLKMTYRQIAERIKKEIKDELDITVSVGIAPSKVLAKVGSKYQKPNGLTEITPEHIAKYLTDTSIDKIWGIGPKTSAVLIRKGINTAQDFANKSAKWISDTLSKPYETIWRELRGEYVLPIDPDPKTEYSSIQKTRSFHPTTDDKVFLLSQLSKHVEEACLKARHFDLTPRKISFFLKDRNFKYSTCNFTLSTPTNAPENIITEIGKRFREVYRRGTLYRTTGVVISELVPDSTLQGDLFGNTQRAGKFEKIHKQIDALEAKFGKKVVYLASTQKAMKRKVKGTDSDDLDRDLLFL